MTVEEKFKKGMVCMITFIPIIVALIGVFIHLLGIAQILKIASLNADIIMFIIDILVVYGLIRHKKWGWYLATILFIQQSIMQPYWAYQNYAYGFFVVHPVEGFIPTALVFLSLLILVMYKKNVTPQVVDKFCVFTNLIE